MSARAAVTGEDDVGSLVNCETIVLVLDRGVFDDQVRRRAIKAVRVMSSRQAVTLRVRQVTLRVVDVDPGYYEGAWVGHAERLRWRIDDVHVLEDTRYFYLHHGAWFCGSAIGALAIPVERSSSVEAVSISVKNDVVATNGEEWACPAFVAEKDVAVKIYDGVLGERERKALTGWDSEAVDINSRTFFSSRDVAERVNRRGARRRGGMDMANESRGYNNEGGEHGGNLGRSNSSEAQLVDLMQNRTPENRTLYTLEPHFLP